MLSVVEGCQTLRTVKQENEQLQLHSIVRKCKYYYYYLDKQFCFIHMKLQTWFPFMIQICINGRELMKHIFEENKISFKMYNNLFFYISDIEKSQDLADRFDSRSLCRQLDMFDY